MPCDGALPPSPGSGGLCELKGALGTIREEVMSTGEGDSTQLEVAVAADPSLGAVPSLLCDARGAARRGSPLQLEVWGPPGPPPSPAAPPPGDAAECSRTKRLRNGPVPDMKRSQVR